MSIGLKHKKPGRPPTIDWRRWGPLLGTMYDRELAGRIGCKILTIHRRRKRLGIPAFRSTLRA
jgi:hypothetical protein